MDSYYGERTAHILADTVSTILRYDDAFAGMDFASTTPLLDSGSPPIQDGIRLTVPDTPRCLPRQEGIGVSFSISRFLLSRRQRALSCKRAGKAEEDRDIQRKRWSCPERRSKPKEQRPQ